MLYLEADLVLCSANGSKVYMTDYGNFSDIDEGIAVQWEHCIPKSLRM